MTCNYQLVRHYTLTPMTHDNSNQTSVEHIIGAHYQNIQQSR